MKTCSVLVLLALLATGQTKVDLNVQARNVPSSGQAPIINAWTGCPGPILTLDSPTQITIGKNWSFEKPCRVYFNVVPPQRTDPVHVATFTDPVQVTLTSPTYVEDVYVWAAPPTFTPVAPAKIKVGVIGSFVAACSACEVVSQTVPRTFPPLTVPMGVAMVRAGAFLPTLHDIMPLLYLGAGAAAVISRDENGYLLRVEAAGATAQQSISALQQAQAQVVAASTESLARTLNAKPPAEKRVGELSQQVDTLGKSLFALTDKIPPRTQDMKDLEERLQLVKSELERLENWAQRDNYQMNEMVQVMHARLGDQINESRMAMENFWRVPAPKTSDEPCTTGQLAYDAVYAYSCLEKKWVRWKIDQKWK